MYKPVRNIKGFTLMEIMIAMSVIAIIIAAFAPLLSSSYSAIFSAGRQSNTLYTIQQKLESDIAGYDNTGEETLNLYFTNFTLNVQGAKIIKNEKYTESNGQERTIKVETFVANKSN
ncbi:hypothetical protein JCM14036_34050 [Desulfotomaculum defluvii]